MKKFLLGSLAFATMALTSCSEENEGLLNNTFEVFTGEIVSSNSRTSLGSDNSVLWSGDDAISLFKKTGYYQKYKVKEGGSATADFVYDNVNTKGSTLDQHYAVYPYAETNSISGQTISLDLSSLANQTYTANSFEEEKAVMVAKSTTTNLQFINALAVIRVNLSIGGAVIDATVSSIKITSKDNKLAGNATIDMSQDKQPAVIDGNANNAGNVIALSVPNVELSQTAIPFYIMIPAGTYDANDLTVEVKAVLNGEYQECEFTLPAVTFERSVITTLSKTFLEDSEWTGTTEGAVEGPWDGETVTMPELVTDDVTGEEYYSVNSASELAGLAALVNGTAQARSASAEVNFKLTGDIDLGAQDWTPIGYNPNDEAGNESYFTGTFDGNGYTISNLKINVTDNGGVGLFGAVHNATFKNFTLKNVDIKAVESENDPVNSSGAEGKANYIVGGHIGAVAGYDAANGSVTFENVHVEGLIKIEGETRAAQGQRIGGIIGGRGSSKYTFENVSVKGEEGSYIKGYCSTAGIIGQNQAAATFGGVHTDIDVYAVTFGAGGIAGIARHGSTFTNCSSAGDITLDASKTQLSSYSANYPYRVGGIVACWSESNTGVLTLSGCSYTGTLTSIDKDGNSPEGFDYAGLVGRGWTLKNCAGSTVIIDGTKYVQASNSTYGIYIVDDVYEIGTATALKWLATEVNSGNDYFAGKTVVLTNDIDLNNEEWTPVGSAVKDHGFCGNFDGNNKKIKNLKITNVTPDAAGYAYAGLFGITENNTIKNLIIENVNIDLDGHIVAATIAYPYYTTVENITVQGDIKIEGKDYTAGILAYTRRCYDATGLTISGNSGSTITGDFTVGGVISDIQTNDNGVNDVNYSNFKASGLTITANNMHAGGISGIICNQTLDGAIVENVTIVCDDVRKGTVSGSLGGVATIKNIIVNNVTGAINVIGGTFDNGSTVVANGDIYTKE